MGSHHNTIQCYHDTDRSSENCIWAEYLIIIIITILIITILIITIIIITILII